MAVGAGSYRRPPSTVCRLRRVSGEIHRHRPPRPPLQLPVHRPREPHEVLTRHGISCEELRRQQRALELIARLTRRHQVARQVTTAARKRDHMIKRGVRQTERSATVNASTSTIPNGLALVLTLVLLVQHTASVAG